MPSHPDRVRRSYHKIDLTEHTKFETDEQIITIKITKTAIASWANKRDILYNIGKYIQKGIKQYYRES